jgi:hypothetical protein
MMTPLMKFFLAAFMVLGAYSSHAEAERPTERIFDETQLISFDFSRLTVKKDRLLDGGTLPDSIMTLLFPEILPAAHEKTLQDDDFVVGVSLNGDTRAYPVKILNWHHGVNDLLGSTPVYVSWDALAGAALAFNRTIEGQELVFGHTGLVYQGAGILYDRTHHSLWSPLVGEAISGDFSGGKIDYVPVFMTRWKMFKRAFPDGTVINPQTGYDRPYGAHPISKTFARDTQLVFPTMYYGDDLPRKELVYGVELTRGKDKVAVAFKLSELVNHGSGRYEFRFGKERIPLAIEPMKPSGRVKLLAPPEVEIKAHYAYWYAWSAHHPHGLVVKDLPHAKNAGKEIVDTNKLVQF